MPQLTTQSLCGSWPKSSFSGTLFLGGARVHKGPSVPGSLDKVSQDENVSICFQKGATEAPVLIWEVEDRTRTEHSVPSFLLWSLRSCSNNMAGDQQIIVPEATAKTMALKCFNSSGIWKSRTFLSIDRANYKVYCCNSKRFLKCWVRINTHMYTPTATTVLWIQVLANLHTGKSKHWKQICNLVAKRGNCLACLVFW